MIDRFFAETGWRPTVTKTAGATAVALDLALPPQSSGKSEFLVNGVPFWKATPFLSRLGERQVWTVKNNTDRAR